MRARVLELARGDERITGGALTGSVTIGAEDRWSDIDTAFGFAEGVDPIAVLDDWSAVLAREFSLLHHFDLRHGPTLYRVSLFPSTLQLDISLTPAREFGARGANFQLVFGAGGDFLPSSRPSATELIGYAWMYVVSARAAIARRKLWQGVNFVENVRNYGLSLASLRHDLPTSYARGTHLLPEDVTEPWRESLVCSLEPRELWRALGVSVEALLREVDAADAALADRLREPLRTAADGA